MLKKRFLIIQHRTFDKYNHVDCFHYADLHDYIKYLKWGYAKVTDHASREIRLKRMSREEGVAMVKSYQSLAPTGKNLSLFLNWLGIKESEFLDYIDRQRDPRIWKRQNDRQWELLDSIAQHQHDLGIESARLSKIEDCSFQLTQPKDKEAVEDWYVLIGRGWVDNK
jgi:hypothetical protein